MTLFDTRFRALATKLVKKFGVTDGVYSSVGYGAMDLNTNSIVSTTTTATMRMSPPIRFKDEDIDGTLIQEVDAKIYIDAPTFEEALPDKEVKTADIITINGETMRVINFSPIYSGNLIAVYKIHVRRGGKNAN